MADTAIVIIIIMVLFMEVNTCPSYCYCILYLGGVVQFPTRRGV